MSAPGLILSSRARAVIQNWYRDARLQRNMGPLTALILTAIMVMAHVLFRLDSPAWLSLKARLAPWFAHLTHRPYQFADPIRYLLQLAWVILVEPIAHIPVRPSRLRTRLKLSLSRVRQSYITFLAKVPGQLGSTAARQQVSAWFTGVSRNTRLLIYGSALIICFPLAALLITQPFSMLAQAVFVGLLWVMALVVKRIPSSFSTFVLIVLSLTVSSRYLWWRYTSTLNLDDPLDAFFGILLLVAETYSWLVLVLGYVQTARPLNRPPANLPRDRSKWPTVDLMIPTYNEDLSVVRPTVYAALGIDWPKDKLRIYLLDDGRRESFRAFAEEVGVNYMIRPDNKHAKAGNLNHALKHTDGELVAIFDCDHIPTRSFLQVTTGWFLVDPKLALVQTPHHFFSPDPFERNLGQYRQQPNENTLFYGLVQDGNDLWNAAFFCGSCAVVRRTAIADIGGFAVETVTEDAHTALRLHRKGYNSAYLRIPQAAGLATESLSAHVGQRIRWARGMIQIFRLDNPLSGKGLSLFQRLCYANAMLHFLAGVPRIIYLIAPLAFLVFHAYILYAPALAILLYVMPHMVHSVITNSHMQGAYRRTFWGEIYETVLAWYIARPTTVALFNPGKGKFNVTAKGGLVEKQYFDWDISHPYVFLALANIVGFFFGVWRLIVGPADEVMTVWLTMIWAFYNLIVLGGAIAVAAEVRQVRKNHRVTTEMPGALLLPGGHRIPVVVTDFSEGGAGLQLSFSPYKLNLKDGVRLIMYRGQQQFSFPAEVSRAFGQQIGLQFVNLTRQQHIDLVQCTFARADSWLVAQESFPKDKPLESLASVLKTSQRGYQQMAKHLPFPLNIAMRGLNQSIAWLVSLLPVMDVTPEARPSPASNIAGKTYA